MDDRFPRIRRKGRRWTERTFWLRLAAVSYEIARITRIMGPRHEAIEALAQARINRLIATRADPKKPMPRRGGRAHG